MTLTNNETIHNVHPWRRYFARLLDTLLMGVLFYILLGIFLPKLSLAIEKTEENRVLDMMLTGFFAMLLNPIVISLTGTTVGKLLFGVGIKDENNNKLPFLTALKREFLVYVKGMAFCIPIINLFTLCSSHTRLKRTGKTSWDEALKCNVTYRKDDLTQKIFNVTGIVLYIVIVALTILPDHSSASPTLNNKNGSYHLKKKHEKRSINPKRAIAIQDAKDNGYIGRNKYIELMQSCAYKGNTYCSALLGDFYYKEGEYHLAYPFLLDAENIQFGKEDIAYELGYMLARGYGATKNEERAIYHFKEGASLGNHDSAYSLGVLYGNRAAKLIDQKKSDQDVTSNLIQSYAWYKVSKILGHETTIKSDSRVQDIDISIEYRKKLLIDRSALMDANKLTTKICADIPKCIERL